MSLHTNSSTVAVKVTPCVLKHVATSRNSCITIIISLFFYLKKKTARHTVFSIHLVILIK